MRRSKRCYIALLLFSTIFLGLFVRSSDASAVSDFSVTITSSSPSSDYLCYNNNANYPNCSDYEYISLIDASGVQYGGWLDLTLFCSSQSDLLHNFTFNSSPFLYVPIKSVYRSYGFVHCSRVQYSISYLDRLSSNSFTFTLLSSLPSSLTPPSGTISITENGTFDVSSYEYAEVNVPAPPVVTPYDNKLDSLIQAVYVVAGTILVIYFFYALYRIYMGGRI